MPARRNALGAGEWAARWRAAVLPGLIGAVLVGLVAWGVLASGARAAGPVPTATAAVASGITVVGDGLATGAPDATTIQLGMTGAGKTPAEALTATSQATDAVVQQLRAAGVAERDVQTSGLYVSPIYQEGQGGPPDPTKVIGYQGRTTIVVQAGDPQQASKLLDVAMRAGATSVDGVSFGIRDDSGLRQKALALAIADARPKAEVAAKAAGLTLGGIRSVEEQPTGPLKGTPAMGMGGGAGMPVGELGVAVRATVTFDVTP